MLELIGWHWLIRPVNFDCRRHAKRRRLGNKVCPGSTELNWKIRDQTLNATTESICGHTQDSKMSKTRSFSSVTFWLVKLFNLFNVHFYAVWCKKTSYWKCTCSDYLNWYQIWNLYWIWNKEGMQRYLCCNTPLSFMFYILTELDGFFVGRLQKTRHKWRLTKDNIFLHFLYPISIPISWLNLLCNWLNVNLI